MAESDHRKKPQQPRRNPALRPPPGVQKAIQNFGVQDLRQLLDKKHQEQRPDDKDLHQKVKLPPPDPQYNYLKDPLREAAEPTPPAEHKKHIEKKRHPPRQGPGRNSDQQNNNSASLKVFPKSPQEISENVLPQEAHKKELRFSDTPEVVNIERDHVTRQSRGSFRGRKRDTQNQDKAIGKGGSRIENPVNIKVSLSLATGQRCCMLDENTKIPDIKHVPDQHPGQKPYRGGRGSFRGRGQGRGSFRGRTNYRKSETMAEATEDVNSTKESDNSTVNQDVIEENKPHLDNEEEEYVDSNENYEEFSSEYGNSVLEERW